MLLQFKEQQFQLDAVNTMENVLHGKNPLKKPIP